MTTTNFVLIRSVHKTYRRGGKPVAALRDISLCVAAGEFVVLLGPSGSGKTTLLNLIAALDRPDAGEIIVAGEDLPALSLAAAARYRNQRIGIVFQSYNLLPQLSALENVLVPMLPRGRLNRPYALELLDHVGLGDRARHRPAELSGGEQQRVAIARAFANDPPLIIADEPTGNLDGDNARRVMELLRRSCRDSGKTLLVATHDRQARQWADGIFELQTGRLTNIAT
jgi:putative ABC transport system ATP-binding protein